MTIHVTQTADATRPPLATVEGEMKFTVDTGVKPVTHITPPGEEPIRNYRRAVHAVNINNGRQYQ